MASEAPSWADQWGEGGIGALPAEDEHKDGNTSKKKDTKGGGGGGGFGKAKAAAQKIKMGTSTGFKWVKSQCQKKTSSSK